MTPFWGSALKSGERVSVCRGCGGGFIPPRFGNCCSERCVAYIAIASRPVLGNSLYCQRDEEISCWNCGIRFRSSGIRLCPPCYFEDRPGSTKATTPAAPRPARHEIVDRAPARSLCRW